MNEVKFISGGTIKLPSGITVGDEFRIAGKVRVTAMAEDLVDTTSYGQAASFLPGSVNVTLVISDVSPS